MWAVGGRTIDLLPLEAGGALPAWTIPATQLDIISSLCLSAILKL